MESDFKRINFSRDISSALFPSEKSEKSSGPVDKSARFVEDKEKDKKIYELESNDDQQEDELRKKHDNELNEC